MTSYTLGGDFYHINNLNNISQRNSNLQNLIFTLLLICQAVKQMKIDNTSFSLKEELKMTLPNKNTN